MNTVAGSCRWIAARSKCTPKHFRCYHTPDNTVTAKVKVWLWGVASGHRFGMSEIIVIMCPVTHKGESV
jgi:hypothetical protein